MYKTYDDHLYGIDSRPARNNTEISPRPEDTDRITIGELSRDTGVTLRALRFYQSKGLLAPQRDGSARIFSRSDRVRVGLIQQGKRLGFTLCEIHDMIAARGQGVVEILPINRKKCVEQIKYLEHQRRDLELALAELRRIYTGMSHAPEMPAATTQMAAHIS